MKVNIALSHGMTLLAPSEDAIPASAVREDILPVSATDECLK